MREPHVQRLHYKIESGEEISYHEPKPISFSNHYGKFELRDGMLRYTPSDHFADEDDARKAVEPFLHSWEIEADLKSNIGMIRFEFERSDMVDLNPPKPGETQVIKMKALASAVSITGIASCHLTSSKYPEPPESFRTTPEVEYCYQRWIIYRAGREPLQSMAYFVLTLIESSAGGRRQAAKTFQIDFDILDKIGYLSTNKGDERTARKARTGNRFQELSGSEKQWLEAAIRKVIHRMGEHVSGAALREITMSELPNP